MSMIYHYDDAGEQTAYVEAPETDPVPLAEAVDAAIDAAAEAAAMGDIGQTNALLMAADLASDALLAALGAVDPDDAETEMEG